MGIAYYENPYQGVFECHQDNKANTDYLKGGGLIITWRQMQPSSENSLDQNALNSLISKLRESKNHYVHFQIYGQTSQQVYPDWLRVYDNDSSNDVIGVIKDSTGTYPQPWDSRYQAKLEKFLNLLGTALRNAGVTDKIEFIEPATGGYWASTHLWLPDANLTLWARAAGCGDTDWNCLGTKFTSGVNAVMEKYFAAFPDNVLMLISGSCSHAPQCNYSGFNTLYDKYGMRLMKKMAGIGRNEQGQCGLRASELGPLCGGANPKTRCAQELTGDSTLCGGTFFDPAIGCGYETTFMKSLNEEKNSYYCLYNNEIGCSGVESINRTVADKAGAQITLTSYTLDGSEKNVGSPLRIDFRWKNQGNVALIAPLKQGVKWVPSSYKIFIEFVKNDGTIASYQEFPITPSTATWAPASTSVGQGGPVNFNFETNTSVTFNVPESLGGVAPDSRKPYKIYAGLTDPNGERKRFALRNAGANNDLTNRRFLISSLFTVVGRGGTPNNPTATSTIPPGNPPNACPADKPARSSGNADCNEAINQTDLQIWIQELLGVINTKLADFNSNGKVDGLDFMIWWQGRG